MSRFCRVLSWGLVLLAAAAVTQCAVQVPAAGAELKKAELLLELPDKCNTPDGMALLPGGDIILSVPNFNDKKTPPLLMKITKDNKLEDFYALPGHPETGRAGPMGIAAAPGGDLYLAALPRNDFDYVWLIDVPPYDESLVASIRPGVRPRLLLGAHWDSRPWADQDPNPAARSRPVPGANDGASGVAVLLVLARWNDRLHGRCRCECASMPPGGAGA